MIKYKDEGKELQGKGVGGASFSLRTMKSMSSALKIQQLWQISKYSSIAGEVNVQIV